MKRIRPKVLIIFFIILIIFIVAINILQFTIWREDGINYKLFFGGILMAIFLTYLILSVKVEYSEECLYSYGFLRKAKADYGDIVKVYPTASPGGYWIMTYDGNKVGIYLPFERKKMAELFDAIKENNPEVAVNVWWYHEERGEKDKKSLFLKTMLKFGLFIVAVCIWDFIMHHI